MRFDPAVKENASQLSGLINEIEEMEDILRDEFKRVRAESVEGDENYYKSYPDFVDVNEIMWHKEYVVVLIAHARRELGDILRTQQEGLTNLRRGRK